MLLVPLLVLALAGKPTPTPSANAPLVGQWESVARTPEGVGNVLQFYPDGRVTQISASMAEAAYRLEGDRLITTWTDPATGKTADVETHVDAAEFGRIEADVELARAVLGARGDLDGDRARGERHCWRGSGSGGRRKRHRRGERGGKNVQRLRQCSGLRGGSRN